MLWLADANYELSFPRDCLPSETVIFPATPYEAHGMEDLRLTRFVEDDGQVHYYGTYTAYDGQRIHPMLLGTPDFHDFHVATLSGRYARNKGMALFPRKINGHFAMLSRQDNENNYLMFSDNIHFWYSPHIILRPTFPWELVQLGNCGSPIETEEGWLVLSHGVGPMRKYCIGAFLLDRHDPTQVIGRLREPLIQPTENEREGYVPNVVYTCGALLHKKKLIIPYAMSDYASRFAVADVDEVIGAME
jgi:predicted GH43/DUF377 family glycosyl hydrolase